MEFTFDTVYDQKAMTALAHVLRKTVRHKHSRRSHLFGWLAMALGLWLSWPFGEDGLTLSARTIFTWLVLLVLLATLLWEDRLNGFIALKRTLPGLTRAHTVFGLEGYHSTTDVGSSDFPYDKILMLAETKEYFAFIFGKSHAQVYDKSSLSGGTVEEFRRFIEEKTGKVTQKLG